MELILVRHAIAAPAASGKEDDLRPLTVEGRNKMRRGARGLHAVAPHVDAIYSSPLIRTMETASIIARLYPSLKIKEIDQLLPYAPTAHLMQWLSRQPMKGAIVLVGHEPDMGRLASSALAETKNSFHHVKKGGACCVVFEKQIAEGNGLLRWALAPAHLRRIGR
jgi:phosphohistidine phosphatase